MRTRTVPTYEQPLANQQATTPAWYRWFQDTDNGTAPSSEKPIEVGLSPFTYQAPRAGFVIITGGTVSRVQFSRTVGTNYDTGWITGMFTVCLNDNLIVTYSGAPTMTFVPT